MGETKKPWYAAGLAFECGQCGRCCAGPEEGNIWVSEDEIFAIANHLNISIEQMQKIYIRKSGWRLNIIEDRQTNDCIFLKPGSDGSKGCSIYGVRPAQCRTWPFWKINLATPNSWCNAGQRCPGINHGKKFTLEEIEARRDAT